MALIVACATDDGINFNKKHFGDAQYYYIYKLENGQASFVTSVDNTTEEEAEEIHADPKKARGIVQILKGYGVQAGIAKVFGPNIKRVKKHFVPVLVNTDTLKEGLEKLLYAYEKIEDYWNKGEERQHLDLRRNTDSSII